MNKLLTEQKSSIQAKWRESTSEQGYISEKRDKITADEVITIQG